MSFLLDANTFIEAKNGPYPFDICPAFWSFVEKENEAGRAFSIKPIGTELCAGNDQLAKWAANRKGLFVPLDPPAHEAAKDIMQYVQSNGFLPAAKAKFLSGADPFLIAYAKAHSHTIVTHEVRDRSGNWNKVKIPNVAHEFDVPCVRVIDWLRTNGFVMR
jgi:hypothetical protein